MLADRIDGRIERAEAHAWRRCNRADQNILIAQDGESRLTPQRDDPRNQFFDVNRKAFACAGVDLYGTDTMPAASMPSR